MSWIQTFTGKKFAPLDPDPTAIDLRDIAHSLSLQCRFNGHCRVFYSVAEHSVRVSRVVPEEDALWGLLHDASEAYVCDLPRPLKHTAPEFRAAEDRLLAMIARRFGLPPSMPPSVRAADDTLLVTEARDLMLPPPQPWGIAATPLDEVIVPLGAVEAEALFLRRFAELDARRAR